MNTEAYMNVSVDHLFEQHTISDIEQVHKKLQNEIEQKRIEIRRFVGERYRDLIQAADSIGEMKGTSGELIGHVNRITNSCKVLHDNQLMGFRNEVSPEVRQERLQKAKFYGVVLQIKVLTQIPELIVRFLEVEDFFIASQLCIFARHIKTGLEVSDVRQKFPILVTIWDTLAPFFEIIKKKCLEVLERDTLEPELATKCLASILLLENSDISRLISVLIDARSTAFLKTLEENSFETAREKILASLKVLNETIDLLHSCFIEGLVAGELQKISHEDTPPTLAFISHLSDVKLKFLPEIVSKFKPHVGLPEVSSKELKPFLEKWMKFVGETSETQVSSIVVLITSIKTIQEVKKQTAKVSKPKSDVFCALGLPENLDFYVQFYQRLVDLRLQQIIQNAWKQAMTETLDEAQAVLKARKTESFKQWLWREDLSDNPQSLKFSLEASNDQKKLLMKANGYTPDIVSLCMAFDKKLEALFNDVKAYLSEESNVSLRLKGDEMPDQIGAFLNDCSVESVNSLITEIKSIKQTDKPENIIIIARLLQAIPQLCPNLRSCLTPSATVFQDTINSDLYTRTSQLLNEESVKFWTKWLTGFCLDLEKKLQTSQVDFNTILKEFPTWEIVSIQEKDEQDNAVESTIRVPAKPSFPLQRFLHETCTALNEIIPHTLPKRISSHLVKNVSEMLFNHYKALSVVDFVKGNQNMSLQYYFDLKFVKHLLVPRDNEELGERYKNLILDYKNFIDPFDFDVFSPYVNENVKKSAQRMQYLIGCLASVSEAPTTAHKQEKDPNVLMLSSNAATITWFPLLPISDPSSDTNAGTLPTSASSGKLSAIADTEKHTLPTSKSSTSLDKTLRTAQNYADNMKSGAAALFGDWFKS